MDETEPGDVVTIGQRLREAREAKGLSVEDIAAQTRIPTRHLTSLEESDWDKLPAATYSVGFAKNYAGAVGLDRNEISEQLRTEMGGTRIPAAHPEIYETADPARTMPKGLVIGALALVVLVVLALSWLSNRSMQADRPLAETGDATAPAVPAVSASAPRTPVATGPVVITATEPVWIKVKDGNAILKQDQLAAGQSYEIPATAAAPVLTTGKPEALRVSIGSTQAPPIGPAGKTLSNVSLKATDLMSNPTGQASPTAAPAPAAEARPAPRTNRRAALPVRKRTRPAAPAATNSTAPAAPLPGQ